MITDSIRHQVTARFDQAAANWDNNPARVALAVAVADAIQRAVPLNANMRVMDFGAGTGLLTLAMAPRVAEVLAVDASGEMLRVMDPRLRSMLKATS